MSDPICLVRARELHAAIIERTLGRTIQSAGQKGRSVSYQTVDVNHLISLYRQLRAQCPEALVELPDIAPLDQPAATRGRPAVFMGRGSL